MVLVTMIYPFSSNTLLAILWLSSFNSWGSLIKIRPFWFVYLVTRCLNIASLYQWSILRLLIKLSSADILTFSLSNNFNNSMPLPDFGTGNKILLLLNLLVIVSSVLQYCWYEALL